MEKYFRAYRSLTFTVMYAVSPEIPMRASKPIRVGVLVLGSMRISTSFLK